MIERILNFFAFSIWGCVQVGGRGVGYVGSGGGYVGSGGGGGFMWVQVGGGGVCGFRWEGGMWVRLGKGCVDSGGEGYVGSGGGGGVWEERNGMFLKFEFRF